MSLPESPPAPEVSIVRALDAAPAPLVLVGQPGQVVIHANPAFVAVAGPVEPGRALAEVLPPVPGAARWTSRLPKGVYRVEVGHRDGVCVASLERDVSSDLEDRLAHAERLATFGRLAAGVVHDLRGPLTAIRVSAEALLSRYALDPSAVAEREKARRIVDSGERLLGLVRNLLAYAKPSREEREDIDVGAMIQSALSLCAHVAEERGALLRGEAEPGLWVFGVRLHLEQVLVNLVTNACQAVARGGLVEIRARFSGDDVVFEARDNGAGIPTEQIGRLFEPFFTAWSTGTGTGLGLSVVRGIVEKHGGTVGVESSPGETRFLVRLPGRRSSSDAA